MPDTIRADQSVDATLRAELARGDIALSTMMPVLTHFLGAHDRSLFSEAIIARVRGMLHDATARLLQIEATEIGASDVSAYAQGRADALAEGLARNAAFLGHCHALAIEWQLADRLRVREGIDPVLSPLLQSLIASDGGDLANTARAVLAAQARFIERQKRMELPLSELPEQQFANLIDVWRHPREDADREVGGRIERLARVMRERSETRLALLQRLIAGLGERADAALSIAHAGPALFLTALAVRTDQDRDIAVVSTDDRQFARFALSLRAAGLDPAETRAQLRCLHPDAAVPDAIERVSASQARELLRSSPYGHAE